MCCLSDSGGSMNGARPRPAARISFRELGVQTSSSNSTFPVYRSPFLVWRGVSINGWSAIVQMRFLVTGPLVVRPCPPIKLFLNRRAWKMYTNSGGRHAHKRRALVVKVLCGESVCSTQDYFDIEGYIVKRSDRWSTQPKCSMIRFVRLARVPRRP